MFRLFSPDVLDVELEVQGALMRLNRRKNK